MQTTSIKNLTDKGTLAVKRLRMQRLQRGLPFMIHTADTDNDKRFYLEYADGSILLAKHQNDAMEFEIIKQLSQEEANNIRTQYQLQ